MANGRFRPDPTDSAFCGIVPACCFEDRDYTWVVNGLDETAILRVETHRYRQPIVTWTIQGQPAKGNGSIPVTVDTVRFDGRSLVKRRASFHVDFVESKGVLEVKTKGVNANFDLNVACSVRDGSITGNVRTDVIATPSAVVGFVGSELELDPAYVQQRDACHKAVVDLFEDVEKKKKFRRPKPGETVELDPGVLAYVPAWAASRSTTEHDRRCSWRRLQLRSFRMNQPWHSSGRWSNQRPHSRQSESVCQRCSGGRPEIRACQPDRHLPIHDLQLQSPLPPPGVVCIDLTDLYYHASEER